MSLATGGYWMGLRCAKLRVLYVDLETDPRTLQRRSSTVASAKGSNVEDVKAGLSIWPLRGQSCGLAQIRDELFSRCKPAWRWEYLGEITGTGGAVFDNVHEASLSLSQPSPSASSHGKAGWAAPSESSLCRPAREMPQIVSRVFSRPFHHLSCAGVVAMV